METFARRLRTPEERVGMLPNASLPPPAASVQTASDEELLAGALRDGNEAALARALDRFFPLMLRTAQYHVGSRATAEEVIQETWMAALRGADRFQGRSSLKTWLFRILRNRARTRGKRDARMRPFSDMVHGDSTSGSRDPLEMMASDASAMWVIATDPESDLLSAELVAHIERAIAALPPRMRDVIVLRDVEGWAPAEVCNALGLSETNQRVLLHRARLRVREQLREYLDAPDICGDDAYDVH